MNTFLDQNPPILYSFERIDKQSSAQMGNKGFNLAQLKKANFTVPDGGVLITEAFDKRLQEDHELQNKVFQLRQATHANQSVLKLAKDIKSTIKHWHLSSSLLDPLLVLMEKLLGQGYPSIAVRSSSVLEDMAGSSFAGQYESVLGVRDKASLAHAIVTCWASAFNSRVIQYCLSRGISLNHLTPALVIQGLIDGEVSGVLFTVDPLSGDDCTMVINAAEGLGEALVQGEITPQHVQYNWYTDHLTPNIDSKMENIKPLLSAQQLKSLCAIALDIQAFYGTPQDIEWSYLQGEFYILQARPIAAIHFSTSCEWSNADFKDGGVASSIPTPLMWSLYESTFESTMPAFLKKVGMHPKQPIARWTKRFMGFPYWNLSAVKAGVRKIPGFIEQQFEADLGIESQHSGSGQITKYTIISIVHGLRILYSINRSIKSRLRAASRVLNDIQKQIVILEQQDVSLMSDSELSSWVKILINVHHRKIEGEYFNTIYDNSNGATLFKDSLRKYNRKANPTVNELHLMGGLDNISHLRHVNELWELSRECLLSPALSNFMHTETVESLCKKYHQQQSYPFSHRLNAFINKHKHHSRRELDLLVKCWDEDPSQVFQSFLTMLTQGEDSNPKKSQKKQKQHFQNELNKITSSGLKKKLFTHRELLVLREEMRDLSTKMYRVIRQAFLELGQRLYKQQQIECPNAIFFLDYVEALQYFRNPQDQNLAEKLQKNHKHYRCFRNFNKPNEIFTPSREPTTKDVTHIDTSSNRTILKGTASSPGVIKGEIWVQNSPDTTTNIKLGTILVAPYTDPSYTLLFSSISGLITEAGGVLSHGAVVSREYGIPAVLAVKHACTRLKTGMRVRIDGYSGEICILSGH
ncbi:hypothetical protein AB835_06755 [Candidatus Endobugula sertula]|uniref:Phosphoenolpyruvate synthase n=1 Tax=Candidatus Endobugula sertula TaxID=62101 RepID=A0A1D2QQH1_9GAMM|nr:hypothetical protein AB835_06755 [Candidatus Endobugula sertula]